MDKGTWWITALGITNSRTWLSDWVHRLIHTHTHTHTHIYLHIFLCIYTFLLIFTPSLPFVACLSTSWTVSFKEQNLQYWWGPVYHYFLCMVYAFCDFSRNLGLNQGKKHFLLCLFYIFIIQIFTFKFLKVY